MKNKYFEEIYRVSRSVNPTRRTNAKRIRVSSGPVPLYRYYNNNQYINFTEVDFEIIKQHWEELKKIKL